MNNIVFFGAGSIGSLFAARLVAHYPELNISLIARKDHVDAISKNGLRIVGKSDITVDVAAFDSIKNLGSKIDVMFLCVKNYQTKEAISQFKKYLSDDCVIVSLQNGLSHLEILKQSLKDQQIIVGVTSHGAQKKQPGLIDHTGVGFTAIGNLINTSKKNLSWVCQVLSRSGIQTSIEDSIEEVLWKKAIINSSINPITAFLEVKNGNLLENPLLKNLVSALCFESTTLAQLKGFDIDFDLALNKTFEVICQTKQNKSSMLQCVVNKKRTEIESINGVFVSVAESMGSEAALNSLFVNLIKEKTKDFS